jgi:A/G-specific adenine glycosylase
MAPELITPDPERIAAIITRLLNWGPKRAFPWREPTATPFQILVAEILLTRTLAESVARIIRNVWETFPTPEEMADAQVDDIARCVRPLGLEKRASQLRNCAQEIVRLGEVPRDRRQLLHLPGVGEYVADAVRVFAFDEAVIPVDAVVGRVLRRVQGYPALGPAYADRALWQVAQSFALSGDSRNIAATLLDLGALVCLPGRPRSDECPLACLCAYHLKDSLER